MFEIDKLASKATTDPNVQKLTVTSTDNRTWSIKYQCNCTKEHVVERLAGELKEKFPHATPHLENKSTI